MLKVTTTDDENYGEMGTLDEIARLGAQKMLRQALENEVMEYLLRHEGVLDEDGHRMVVRNGKARTRKVALGVGRIEISASRVDDRREGERFTSQILPPYMRRSPKLSEVLPVLYLRGLSSGDFAPALSVLLGENGKGFSASMISRLKNDWVAEYETWRKRSLADKEYVYIWVDGIHTGVRLGDDKSVCSLVVVGADVAGEKDLIAIEDGYRESKESWLMVLRDLKERGMKAPLLAVGDGALGFWGALSEAFPETAGQRCWVHKIRNVLNSLPKGLQAKAKAMLHEIMNAETRAVAEEEAKKFAGTFEAKHPKAVECLKKDLALMLAFFSFPAEHWVHLRTTNPIESPFATVRLRTYRTKGAGSRTMALTMTFKLLESAQKRWRKINAPDQARKLWQGTKFIDGLDVTSSKPEVNELPGKKVVQTKRKAA